MIFLDSSNDSGESEVVFVKTNVRAQNFLRLLGPSVSNIVSRLQIPKSSNFLRFSNFIGFILFFGENKILFVKSGARVLELWLDTSSEPKWPKCSF